MHCKSKPKVQCKTRKQACAMQMFSGSAVQNPETSMCTAKVRRMRSAEARKQPSAMQPQTESALLIPQKQLEQCIRSTNLHCSS
jgi:hypothetical protein